MTSSWTGSDGLGVAAGTGGMNVVVLTVPLYVRGGDDVMLPFTASNWIWVLYCVTRPLQQSMRLT